MNSARLPAPVDSARPPEDESAILPWLRHLQRLFPMSHALVVGAGGGSSPWIRFLREADVLQATLVEADALRFHQLKRATSLQTTWSLQQRMIAAQRGLSIFHRTSIPGGNGLMTPDELAGIWPRIALRDTIELDAISLGDLMENLPCPADWLFINCLPVGNILAGAKDRLSQVNIIVAKTARLPPDKLTSHNSLHDLLESAGFRLLASESNRNPMTGYALYCTRSRRAAMASSTYAGGLAETPPAGVDAISLAEHDKRPIVDEGKAANRFYLNFPCRDEAGNKGGFVLIDSKSLPRSGIHYMKTRFQHLYRSAFSFCEWYHEVGCCKTQPCRLTCYAQYADRQKCAGARMIKSHDFNNDDVLVDCGPAIQRVILARDPLYILTSWFEIDQVERYKTELLNSGIDPRKIWLSHEPALLDAAKGRINDLFRPPSAQELASWLRSRSDYIIGFANKWIADARNQTNGYVHLVNYEEIDDFVRKWASRHPAFPNLKDPGNFPGPGAGPAPAFENRSDPFRVDSKVISEYMEKNRNVFIKACARILKLDQSGYLKTISRCPKIT